VRPLAAVAAAAAAGLALGAGPARPQGPDAPRDSLPWRAGERLEYGVKFGLFTVGRGSLEVLGLDTVRDVESWHVRMVIRGGALGYDLVDTTESWFGVTDLLSRRFVRNSDEDGRQRSRHFEILPESGYYVRNGTDTAATVAEPLDDASFFFYVRTMSLEVGETYTIPRYFIRDRNPVQLRVLARQTISVPAGRFRTIVVRPLFRSRGLFGQGGQALIWLTDDAQRIPVRIRGTMRVGTLELSLRARR
jgi:hypothetical protein